MYVNLRLALGQLNRAYLVPQAALQRDTTGPFVKVVNAEGKVEQKRVTSESARGSNWVVTSGLMDGDQLIVTNFAKARPGMPAKAVPTGSAGQAAPVSTATAPSGAPPPAQAGATPPSKQ
jgi:membrane fusion protein (multidrug efflux system)